MKKKLLRGLCLALIFSLVCSLSSASAFTMQSEMITISIGQQVEMLPNPPGDYTWKSSDRDVATVSNGTIKGIRAGYSVVTANADDETGYVGVKVVSGNTVKEISLSSDSLKMYVGVSKKLSAYVSPADAQDRSGKWLSSNKNVATVSKDGTVRGKGVGTCVITAVASSGVTQTCAVTVLETPVESIKLSAKSGKLLVGNSLSLTASVAPANAANSTLAWYSLNESVATVSQTGEVTALAEGQTKIVAQSILTPNTKAVYSLTVVPVNVSSVKVVPAGLTLSVGAKLPLASSVLPANATDPALVWKSSKPGIVHVEDGVVTAVSRGTATVSAIAADGSGKKARCVITVK